MISAMTFGTVEACEERDSAFPEPKRRDKNR
jgi:hypothetical protein